MAPVVPRQLGSLISEALQSRISTASEAIFGPATSIPPVQPTTPPAPVPTPIQTTPIDSPTLSIAPITSDIVSQAPVPSVTPTISVIIFTTTTNTTPAVTSATDIATSSTPIPSLVLTTPPPNPTDVPATSLSSSFPTTTSGVAAGAGTDAQTTDKGMSGGIIALIVVGALLAALLAGAFTFRRVQVHRRAKRRENNYGAGSIPDAPFPFTNVSETDMKGAEPIPRDFRQNNVTYLNEKPLPSIAPVIPAYGGSSNLDFNPSGLDIRDGDWVTIVHAYDDGWAMCERNGRRGVVPLECLDLGRPDLRASRRLSSLSALRQ
ncbi:hypothetical protein FRC07_011916 [Ceratobasidium sp. 392]|nr:hypothetical protein FRC07_011916 [Ceratobasidium sp. 392]